MTDRALSRCFAITGDHNDGEDPDLLLARFSIWFPQSNVSEIRFGELSLLRSVEADHHHGQLCTS
ncbi:hypothetical protein L484_025991 [Morus notabilis]|uniref:Uncharacterized protein n=1 Tax=Morus notabilis TaxID=981085 RepID=W9RFR3_9ROSA|nr:hypothetical protein L484_025991 [Morus notabilis]